MGKLRIISGEYRSRVIEFNDKNIIIRPTLSRIRETLFNWLGQDLTNKVCLDLFSGSGSLAFESASRNAFHVYAIESNYNVYLDLIKNQKLLNCKNLSVSHENGIHYLEKCKSNLFFDIIFLDPPFDSNLLEISLTLILNKQLLHKSGVLYIEYQKPIKLLNNFHIIKQGRAGVVNYALISAISV